MLTFKQFVQEGNVGTGSFARAPLTAKQVTNLIKLHCHGWASAVSKLKRIPIWRGDNNHLEKGSGLSFGDSNHFKRTAANTSNWYNLWMDGSSVWERFPKRTSSYICSMSEDIAQGYGASHIVIPFDNALIAVAPTHDLWVAFKQQADTLFAGIASHTDISNFQKMISDTANIIKQTLDDTDFTELRKNLESITVQRLANRLSSIADVVNKQQPGVYDKFISIQGKSEKADFLESMFSKESQTALRHISGMSNMAFCYLIDGAVAILKVLKRNKLNNLAELYNAMFDPSEFNVGTGLDIANLADRLNDNECWIQGKCIFIDKEQTSAEDLEQIAMFLRDEYNINPNTIMN